MSDDTYWYTEVDFHPTPEQVLELGEEGDDVLALQQQLRQIGYDIKADGDFGNNTYTAVKAFQRLMHLPEDGRVGPVVEYLLTTQKPEGRLLSQHDLNLGAKRLGCDVSALMAVREVESRGSGFFKPGYAAILFERHVMRRRMIHNGLDPSQAMAQRPDLVSRTTGGYIGGLSEYTRLEAASDFSDVSAHESCSWGMFQVMGYHWETLSYSSIEEYVTLMQRSEANHLIALIRFIENDPGIHQALKDKDWARFARGYNGRGYAKNRYDKKLAAADNKYQQQLDTTTLSM